MLFLFSLHFATVSGWWLLGCWCIGLLYAGLFYSKNKVLPKTIRYLLFGLRTISIFILSALLLSPVVKTTSNIPEKPLILILQDNSSSVNQTSNKEFNSKNFIAQLEKIKSDLGNGYDVRTFHFSKDLKDGLSPSFEGRRTDIASAMNTLYKQFSNRNIGAIVLVTDGVYNVGASPIYEAEKIRAPIYTIALGDTVPRKDIAITQVNYNKMVALGNEFLVEVTVEAYQSKGEQIQLQVHEKGKQIFSGTFPVTDETLVTTKTIKLQATHKGMQQYQLSISPLKNELSIQNNSETIRIDVIDEQKKILLLYAAPHPDIAVFSQALENNQHYQVKTSMLSSFDAKHLSEYQLIIYYQLPGLGQQSALTNSTIAQQVPSWFIVGAQTNIQAFNKTQELLSISPSGTRIQEVFPSLQPSFNAFTLSDSTRQKLLLFPPLFSSFGNFSSSGQILLHQQIGQVETAYPLLVFGEINGIRRAVLAAEGIWKWKMAEFERFGSHQAVNELISQSVQYLTANSDRPRFIVYNDKTIFDEDENLNMQAELYNDARELVNTPDVNIDLKDGSGKTYSFLFSKSGKTYTLNAGLLPPGDYTYGASVKYGDKSYQAQGEVFIKTIDIEQRQNTADHQLLYKLSANSGAEMLRPGQIDKLAPLIRKNELIKTVVYEDHQYTETINIKWVFLAILMLLSIEWFLRKRNGAL